MKNQVRKDKKKRNLKFKTENKKIILKSICNNGLLPKPVRWNSNSNFLQNNLVNSNKNVNRCVLTGRKKQVNKLFKFSRLSFLKFARNGYVSGLIKSTW